MNSIRYQLTFIACLGFAGFQPAIAADNDFQQWSLVFANHNFANNWSASMQVESRWSDDKNAFDEVIVKPAGYYRFTDRFQLGFGYKHITKYKESNEQDLWQEIYYKTPISKYAITHQARLEQRDINGISGILPRLRYLINVQRPLNATYYLKSWGAVRFNLGNKGEGPVAGFEQNRIFFGLGAHTSKRGKFEVGYLWKYEKTRDDINKSDHVISLQFHFNTKGQPHPSHAGT